MLVLALALGSGAAAALAANGPTSAPLNAPVVGIAGTPDGGGYWLVGADGGVFAHGDAHFQGSLAGKALNAPIAGISATPDGRGYWLVAGDGGVFAFGDAHFEGSLAGKPLSKPIVGIASTPTGAGYWLVGGDGGVFAQGDAGFQGSLAGRALNAAIVGITATPTGRGYLLVGGDGGVFAFGDARFYGSEAEQRLNAGVVGIIPTPTGNGYTLAAADGGVFTFGDAQFNGTGNIVSPPPPQLPRPPGPAPPVVGRTVDITPTAGKPLVRPPGATSFVPATAPISLQVGTQIDTTASQVKLTAAGNADQPAQSVLLDSGLFTVTQSTPATTSAPATVEFTIDALKRCSSHRHSHCSHGPSRLWGNGQGHFTTNGRDSSTTVRGTHWLVEDLPGGTLTVVRRGVVTVRDRARRRTVTVRAGQHYLARRRRHHPAARHR